jgi:hypothetical protein
MGALAADEIFQAREKLRWVVKVLIGIGIAQGVLLFAIPSMKLPFHSNVANRPIFCGKEMRGEALMPAVAPD